MHTSSRFILLFTITLLMLSPYAIAQDLPKGLTDAEKELMKTYVPPVWGEGFTTPPVRPVRTMAEWEELDGIIITWTSYTSILRQVVDYAQDEGMVYIVCSDSNAVKSSLQSGGVPLVNLKFIIAPFNSIWVRDYGPWSVYADGVDSMYLVDWIYNRPRPLDDAIPGVFASYRNIPLYQTTGANALTNTGGNFMADGYGTGFASKLILTDNPALTEAQIDTLMRRYMGINRYIKMNSLPYDGIHHIDMHMKLLDEETLLVGQYPQGISDGPYIEANLQYVRNNFQSVYGRPYKVVRIPMPPDGNGLYPSNGGHYRTYTNSIIINKTVIVPTYELQYDTTALRIYREAMPGYRIVGINSNQIIPASGAIHCITKEVGVAKPILIRHMPITAPGNSPLGIEFTASVKSMLPVGSVKVHWTKDTALGFSYMNMQETAPGEYSTRISQQAAGTKVYYYLSVESFGNKTITKPMTAPKGFYQFIADGIVPVAFTVVRSTVSGKTVTLDWATGSETNNRGFEIERNSGDGWTTVGFIPGAGTTANPQQYRYTDEPGTGTFTYRLKQIDFDGMFAYSAETIATVNPLTFSLEQNYPNPFNPATTVRFSLPERANVNLRVFDITGTEVAMLANGIFEAGVHSVVFNAHDLPSGLYFCRIETPGTSAVIKMTLMK